MLRKIIGTAAILTLGALCVAPAAQAANVNVSATVSTNATITATTNATTTSWTGAAVAAVPFTVTVVSNDAAGYQYTFTGTNAATGAFKLFGTAIPGNSVVYTVAGTGADNESYTNGVLGTTIYPGPTPALGTTSTFNVGLPVQPNVTADAYTDILVVAVNPT